MDCSYGGTLKYLELNKKYKDLKKKRTELVAGIASGSIPTKSGLKRLKSLDNKLYSYMYSLGSVNGK